MSKAVFVRGSPIQNTAARLAILNFSVRYPHCVLSIQYMYKACPSESGTEVGAPLFPAVELCDFSGRWQCMSGEIWYTLDSGSLLLTETEAR